MAHRDIEVRRTAVARAPREVVWEVLTDHASYAEWTDVGESRYEVEGDPAPNGFGAIRLFSSKDVFDFPHVSREEINHFWPPHVMGYRMLPGDGVPAYDHQGIVVLTEVEGGTEIAWHMVCNCVDRDVVDKMRARSLGPNGTVQRLVEQVAAEAERRYASQS